MDPWPFVIGAYAATLLGAGALFAQSYWGMRKREHEAEQLGRRDNEGPRE
jgi:hypothetical protein